MSFYMLLFTYAFFNFLSIKKKVKKGSGSKTLPSSNSPSRAVESPTMGRRLPADPAEAIGTAVVKYNYQVGTISIYLIEK